MAVLISVIKPPPAYIIDCKCKLIILPYLEPISALSVICDACYSLYL